MSQENTSPQRRSGRSPEEDAAWRHRRLESLLRRVDKDPSRLLTDRRCRKPRFCKLYFELCDDKCLREPGAALKYARLAVELARRIDDPHLIQQSFGVLVHALVTVRQWAKAAELLESYRVTALACCSDCAGDWLRRRGDLLVEVRDPEGAHEAVAEARRYLGTDLEDDMSGRIRFIRAIAFHEDGDRERALEDAGKALLELALDTPRGYFMDTLAFIACYLQWSSERRHYEIAREVLDRFRERLMDLRGWGDVRLRLAWVEGHVCGRLGEQKRAGERLERVFEAFVGGSAPVKQALAVMADRAQLLARRASDTDIKAILWMLKKCRRLTLDGEMKKRLKEVLRVVSQQPEKAWSVLAMFRFSFVVPVPGLLSEAGRLR